MDIHLLRLARQASHMFGAWRLRKKRSVRTTRRSPPASTTWPCCTRHRAAAPKPSCSSNAAARSAKRWSEAETLLQPCRFKFAKATRSKAHSGNFTVSVQDPGTGVVTLSQIERILPTTASVSARDFNDLACCPIAEIRLLSLNVTTFPQPFFFRSVIIASAIQ
jgi:hypothetical protein